LYAFDVHLADSVPPCWIFEDTTGAAGNVNPNVTESDAAF